MHEWKRFQISPQPCRLDDSCPVRIRHQSTAPTACRHAAAVDAGARQRPRCGRCWRRPRQGLEHVAQARPHSPNRPTVAPRPARRCVSSGGVAVTHFPLRQWVLFLRLARLRCILSPFRSSPQHSRSGPCRPTAQRFSQEPNVIDAKDYFESGLQFHGHKCPAMPMGLQIGRAHV